MKNNTGKYVNAMTSVAIFVSVIAVLAQISIPVPLIPITLQVFAVSLAGYTLGKKKSILSVIIYLLLGTVGAPVFAGFKGGFYVLISYTGGFLFGFIPLAFLCAFSNKRYVSLFLGFVGVCVCHLIGVVQYSLVSETNIWLSFVAASLPYLLKDIVLVLSAHFVAGRVNKIIKDC